MLTGGFALLEEPMEDFEIAAVEVFPADGHEEIRSERQRAPRDPMQKLKLLIIRSISRSRFVKTGTRVGGCG
jgi:hypothetical protein